MQGTSWGGTFPQISNLRKRPTERPNDHLPEIKSYPKLPQDMGDLWFHWVGFVQPQKMGIIWVCRKKMNIFGPKMSLGGRPDAPRATGSTQKPWIYGIPSWQWQKIGWCHEKNWFGAKKLHFWAFLGLKIRFILRYANLTPLFRLRRTRPNGIITSPCPEVTLDTFGFPIGVRSAARRAVF